MLCLKHTFLQIVDSHEHAFKPTYLHVTKAEYVDCQRLPEQRISPYPEQHDHYNMKATCVPWSRVGKSFRQNNCLVRFGKHLLFVLMKLLRHSALCNLKCYIISNSTCFYILKTIHLASNLMFIPCLLTSSFADTIIAPATRGQLTRNI